MASSSAAGGGEDQPVKRRYGIVDPEHTIDCPICRQHLSPPVLQCWNGHIACSRCWTKAIAEGPNVCHSCDPPQPVRAIRCLALEKVLESLRVSCKYETPGGCKEMLKYFEIEEHERSCKFNTKYSQFDRLEDGGPVLVQECPVCNLDTLRVPIFECRNGHLECSICYYGSPRQCTWCKESIARIQCVAREKVLEAMRVSYSDCKQYSARKSCNLKIEKHKAQLCKYGTYRCPVPNCGHKTLLYKMFDHMTNVHDPLSPGDDWNFVALNLKGRTVKFSMRKSGKKFMIVHTRRKGLSVLVHCSEDNDNPGVLSFFCTMLGSSEVRYNLKVKQARDGYSATYYLESSAPSLKRKGEPPCQRGHLVIPYFIPAVFDSDEAWVFDVELTLPEV